MHGAAADFVRRALARDGQPVGLTVEIGGRNVNGSIRSLFAEPYVSVDVLPGDGVDVVASGADYRPPAPAACVVCCEVLEHTADAEAICRNALAILALGGRLILTAAGERRTPHSAIDGAWLRAGEYYANVTVEQLERWLAGFEASSIETNPAAGDIYATAVKGRT